MKTTLWVLCFWLCCGSAVLLPGAAAAAAAATPLTAVLARLEGEAAGVQTLSADFVQEKHLAMFQEVLTSKGLFYFAKPDRLRWELTTPVASGFVLNGSAGRRWHEHGGGSEAFDIAREPVMKVVAEQLLAWAKADFVWLRGQYRIRLVREQPVTLRLDPLVANGFLDHLQIAFAADGRHVAQVEMYDQDGDFTSIRFLNAVVNAALPVTLF